LATQKLKEKPLENHLFSPKEKHCPHHIVSSDLHSNQPLASCNQSQGNIIWGSLEYWNDPKRAVEW
jgi:hypothetical protein